MSIGKLCHQEALKFPKFSLRSDTDNSNTVQVMCFREAMWVTGPGTIVRLLISDADKRPSEANEG